MPNRQRSLHSVHPLRRALFGKPIPTEEQEHARLSVPLGLSVFASDAISSVAYASQEILYVLGGAGLFVLFYQALYNRLTLGITAAIVVLLAIVITSYRQTVFAYPNGGGSYIVTKENLGTAPGLVAAAAILIDYALTVAVSISAGVQNIIHTPIAVRFGLANHELAVCVALILMIAYANLRGMRESGRLFAIPAYTFIGIALLMLALGLAGPALLGWEIYMGGIAAEYERALAARESQVAQTTANLAGLAMLGLVLHAFASGCAAMTGTEAVADGVPAFRQPRSRNAALSLLLMAIVLATLFLGISALATRLHVVYVHYPGHETSPAVIDQLAGAVFGKTGAPWRVALYYVMQIATMMILVVASQTSFADFPRLSAILARDRFMPRQLANQGDRLVFTNGILLLALAAITLVIAFNASVDRLIPLYAVGVFTAFTLSQSGMVMRWWRVRGPWWQFKSAVNGLGAACTGIVLAIVVIEKFLHGAWLVIIMGGVLIWAFWSINRHYQFLRGRLSLVGYSGEGAKQTNTVLLLVPSLHRGILPALEYARSISPDCRAINVETDPDDTPRLLREWEQFVGEDIPLVVLPSPYRSLIGPLLAYLDQVQAERDNHIVTVVVPQFVPLRWWHSALHNANGVLVKYYLSQRPGVIVSNFRYFLEGTDGPGSDGTRPAGQGAAA